MYVLHFKLDIFYVQSNTTKQDDDDDDDGDDDHDSDRLFKHTIQWFEESLKASRGVHVLKWHLASEGY